MLVSASTATGVPSPVATASGTRSMEAGKGFGSIGSKCPNHSNIIPLNKKLTLLEVVQRCNAMPNMLKERQEQEVVLAA